MLDPMCAALARAPWSTKQVRHEGAMAHAGVHWAASARAHRTSLLHRDPASGCSVAADARLDGRDALQAQLGVAGHAGNACSDAELILHAWLRWENGCLERLDGDFTFAVHDPRSDTLFLARDRLGVRPLYVHHAPGKFVAFASGPTAVVAHPSVPRALNEARIADFLVTQLEGIDKTSTFHRDVERLSPAHWLRVDAGKATRRRYWSFAMRDIALPATDEAWTGALTEALERAVSRHLASPGAVGCMLSGGMDSSSLTAIAAQQLAARHLGPLPTFSFFDSRQPNIETEAIRAMLALPGLAPQLLDHVESGPRAEALWATAWAVEEPFDAIMLPIHSVYRAASEAGLETLIDGVDGDTPFLPGNGLARQMRRLQLVEAWRNARGIAAMLRNDPPAWRLWTGAARTALVPDAVRRLRRRLRPRRPEYSLDGELVSEEFAGRIDLPARLQQLQAWRSATPRWSALEDAREDLDHPYAVVGLERYHRVAATHGIEPAHPFLDRRVLELCMQLPDRQRMSNGWTKALLRRAMADRLPPAVLQRRDKQHLGWAQNRALIEAHRSWLLEQLQAHRARLAPYVADAALARITSASRSGSADDGTWEQIFNLAALGNWLARHSSESP